MDTAQLRRQADEDVCNVETWFKSLATAYGSTFWQPPFRVIARIPHIKSRDWVPGHFRPNATVIKYNSITPWSTVLHEKLTVSRLVKKFLAFYGTRRFITVFIRTRHLSLSWARSIQSMPPQPISWRSISILSSHLSLVSFPQFSSLKLCIHFSSPPIRSTCAAHLILLDCNTRKNIWWGVQIIKILIM